jgi:preprotein translocase subunit SecG
MLPTFMNDDNTEDNAVENNEAASDGNPSQGSLQNLEQDYLVPAEHGRNLKRSTITLAILFSVGVLCLWFMIKQTGPKQAAASTEEAQIEKAIAQLTGIKTEMNSRMDEVVDKFYQFSDVEQVEVDELKRNPFVYDFTPEAEDGADKYSVNREMLKQEMDVKSGKMRLWSIMESPQGSCCMIDDDLFYEGDKIQDLTITRIEESFVELSSMGITVKLKMSE